MFAEAVFVALCLAGAASAGALHPAPSPLYAPAPVLAGPRVLAAPAKALVAPVAPVAAVPVTAQSYSFGYNSADEFGTRVQRQETSDINNVRTGSYGYADAKGIFRHVTYVADAGGFRAAIDTNEPGTAQGQTAGALYNAAPLQAAPVAAPAPVVAAAPYRAAAVPVAAPYAAYAVKPAGRSCSCLRSGTAKVRRPCASLGPCPSCRLWTQVFIETMQEMSTRPRCLSGLKWMLDTFGIDLFLRSLNFSFYEP
ncbi:hypothetical protein MTO96_004110 [Rhipicephalus appendiculatus]